MYVVHLKQLKVLESCKVAAFGVFWMLKLMSAHYSYKQLCTNSCNILMAANISLVRSY